MKETLTIVPPEAAANHETDLRGSATIIGLLDEYYRAIERKNPQEEQKALSSVLDALESVGSVHGLEPENYNTLLDQLDRNSPSVKILIRGSKIERVLPSAIDDENIRLGHHGIANKPYPNAASGTVEGLAAAFEQGSAHQRGMRTAIVFEANDMVVKDVSGQPHYKQVAGIIQPQDIKHLILRLPHKNFPEDRLTDQEREVLENHPDLPFVFRAFKKSVVQESRLAA